MGPGGLGGGVREEIGSPGVTLHSSDCPQAWLLHEGPEGTSMRQEGAGKVGGLEQKEGLLKSSFILSIFLGVSVTASLGCDLCD